jgi:putative SOS response-associated peptidase YedK
MCGRIAIIYDIHFIREVFRVTLDGLADHRPRYNVPPTALVPVVTSEGGVRSLEPMRWGLISAWSKDDKPGYSTFNARADTIAVKPAFRSAWTAKRRCLIVAGEFYEWRKSDRQPYFIALGNRQPMAMAGLWEEWTPPAGETVRLCAVITTEANALMAGLHDRMPVILGPEDWASWLGEEPLDDPAALLRPFPPERMTLWPVDRRVGNVRNDDPALIEPVRVASL